MSDASDAAIRRLEEALALLRREDVESWYEAYLIANQKARDTEKTQWAAIRDLIVVATHGAPHELSYLDEELKALIDQAGDEV